jgi:PTS system mannose-specific IIB component/fructoselysine and glucoselysine-specific PTS system IIB component
MPIVLYRVDERLIHGQVVIGWGHQLRPGRFVLVDDDLSRSAWEQDLYRLGAAGSDMEFVSVDEARTRIDEWRSAPERTILLTRDLGAMRGLAAGGLLAGEKVNLGGIHHGPDRIEVLNYLHVTRSDRDDLRALRDEGVEVSAQDLPDAPRVGLDSLLNDGERPSE